MRRSSIDSSSNNQRRNGMSHETSRRSQRDGLPTDAQLWAAFVTLGAMFLSLSGILAYSFFVTP